MWVQCAHPVQLGIAGLAFFGFKFSEDEAALFMCHAKVWIAR
jgi:hypothetical protein